MITFRSLSARDVNLTVKLHRPAKIKQLMITDHTENIKRIALKTSKRLHDRVKYAMPIGLNGRRRSK